MKGDKHIFAKDLKAKFSRMWGVTDDVWTLTLMGKGYYMMNLKSDDLKSRFLLEVLYS